MSTGYAEKSALFNEVQKALKALNLRAKQYGVDEVYNWCKFVLGAKPGSFTEGQQIAAAFFMQTVHKFLDGLIQRGARGIKRFAERFARGERLGGPHGRDNRVDLLLDFLIAEHVHLHKNAQLLSAE